jgi:hypothetical protein
MKTIYTRPSGKTFEVVQVIRPIGDKKTLVKYVEGKGIATQAVWNKNLSVIN